MAASIARLAACFDGTWNNDRSNTNVSRLFRLIATEQTGCDEQRVFYDEGVGTRWGERVLGGMFGIGLDQNIRQGWAWLGQQFSQVSQKRCGADGFIDDGPDIFLFGFSRGAFTARSLGGMIDYLGLPDLRQMGAAAAARLVDEAWQLYVERPTAAARADANAAARVRAHDERRDEFRRRAYHPVAIHFIGVWDTVGALGIPRLFDSWSLGRPSQKYRFHNTRLGASARHAYHAVAIDEHRAPYCVTLWTEPQPAQVIDVEQRWFAGAHSDVGGGYEDGLLPSLPLAWIAGRAAHHGLCFIDDRRPRHAADSVPRARAALPAAFELDGREHLSAVHDSYGEFMFGAYRALRALPGAGGRAWRRMLVAADGLRQTVDGSANLKVAADADYRPPNLAQAGRVDVSYNVATVDAAARA